MIRVVKLSFKPAHSNDFNELFEERKERIKSFQGCTYLELWQDHNEEGVFYTYSIWDDEQKLEAYRMSTFFQETWSIIKPWFSQKPMAFSANKRMIV
jgi:quinol monooxygenase YgiN